MILEQELEHIIEAVQEGELCQVDAIDRITNVIIEAQIGELERLWKVGFNMLRAKIRINELRKGIKQ